MSTIVDESAQEGQQGVEPPDERVRPNVRFADSVPDGEGAAAEEAQAEEEGDGDSERVVETSPDGKYSRVSARPGAGMASQADPAAC